MIRIGVQKNSNFVQYCVIVLVWVGTDQESFKNFYHLSWVPVFGNLLKCMCFCSLCRFSFSSISSTNNSATFLMVELLGVIEVVVIYWCAVCSCVVYWVCAVLVWSVVFVWWPMYQLLLILVAGSLYILFFVVFHFQALLRKYKHILIVDFKLAVSQSSVSEVKH